jgi:outer membrane protein assembly factor BamB
MNLLHNCFRACLFVALLFLLLPLMVPASAADWPQFLGPARNATSAETGLRLDWQEGLPKLWEKKIGEGFSGPVVAGYRQADVTVSVEPRLILFHRLDDKEMVECLEPASGKEIWKFSYKTDYRDDYAKGDGPRATPAVAGNQVFTLGAEGRLHCLELGSGNKVWERSINTEYNVRKGFFGVATSPIVEGDRVLINVGGKNAGIVAFDVKTGQEAWKATDDEASYSSPTAATIDGVRHVFFFTRAGLVSVAPESGAIRFSKPWRSRLAASVNAAAPLVVDNLVFISSEYGTGSVLLKVGKNGAEEVWKAKDVMSNHYNTSVHQAGFLYGIDGRQEEGARLRCVELKTGKVRWTREGFGCASIILAAGHLIALTESGELALIEATPEAYREKARHKLLSPPCRAEIALADGRLFARDNGKLICLSLKKP